MAAARRAGAQAAPPRRREPRNLNDVLDEIAAKAEQVDGDSLTLGDILHAVGRRSYGPLLLVIGLIAISPITAVPGMTWLVAALTLVVAGQMALGLRRPWMPRAALNARISRNAVQSGVRTMRGFAKGVDRLLKPRLEFLSAPPFVNLVGLCCIAAALATFPLGLIPLAPLAPGAAVVAFGLGATARDGLWLAFGMALSAGAAAVAATLIF